MKIVVSDPKSGRSKSIELNADAAVVVVGKKIGDSVDGGPFGLSGYKLKITGGSDLSGFPMDRSIQGTGKVNTMRMIAVSGQDKGQYRRKMVRGGIVTQDEAQVNLAILEYGEKSVDEIMPPKAAGEKKEEAPAKAAK